MSTATTPDSLVTAPVAWAVQLNGRLRATLFCHEIADLMNVSVDRVQELCRTGRLPTVQLRPGSRKGIYLVPVGAYLEFLRTYDAPVPTQ